MPTIIVEYCKRLHLGRLQPCLQILDKGRKWLAVTDAPPYNSVVLITVVKSFSSPFPGVNVINLFTWVVYKFL
jgi:hypothetical protein